jgi:hypothetical protein
MSGKKFGLEHLEANFIKRLVRIPAILQLLYTNQVNVIWNAVGFNSLVQAREAALHAAPACGGR